MGKWGRITWIFECRGGDFRLDTGYWDWDWIYTFFNTTILSGGSFGEWGILDVDTNGRLVNVGLGNQDATIFYV